MDMSFIWKDKPNRLNKKIDLEVEETERLKVSQHLSLRITVDMKYPTDIDFVSAITKGKITISLPEGCEAENARLTNVELL